VTLDIFQYGVSQPFGVPDSSWSGHHTGVDLLLPLATPVPAEGPGTVESVFVDRFGGNQVKIKYASGAEGWFAHLATIFVQPGQQVSPTTEIALSGDTGMVTGPHLHFELRDPGGTLVDPMLPQDRTFIGGLADPHANDCPAGQVRNVFGVCVVQGAGPHGQGTGNDPITGQPQTGLPDIPATIAKLNPLAGVPEAITAGVDALKTGAVKLGIAALVVGVVGVLAFGGVKKTLD
jgi:hypothetical protein